jgi:hypothetical protein
MISGPKVKAKARQRKRKRPKVEKAVAEEVVKEVSGSNAFRNVELSLRLYVSNS